MAVLCACGAARDKARPSARSETRPAKQCGTAQEIYKAELSNGGRAHCPLTPLQDTNKRLLPVTLGQEPCCRSALKRNRGKHTRKSRQRVGIEEESHQKLQMSLLGEWIAGRPACYPAARILGHRTFALRHLCFPEPSGNLFLLGYISPHRFPTDCRITAFVVGCNNHCWK